jgi:hypothetical protein
MKTSVKGRSVIDDRLDSKLRTGTGVDVVLEEHISVWDSFLALSMARTRLGEYLVNSQQAVRVKITATKSATHSKKSEEAKLVALCRQVSGIMFSYVKQTGNEDLAVFSELNKTDFTNVREGTTLEKSRLLYELALEHQSNLEPFGLEMDLLVEFGDHVNFYEFWVNKAKLAKSSKVAATQMLRATVKEMMDFLKFTMDGLMTRYEQSHPKFFVAYKNARKVTYSVRHQISVDGDGNNTT